MKHTICIFNDRNKPMGVTVQNHMLDDGYVLIEPQSYKFIEIHTKGEQVLFLKVWETGQTLLSGIDLV